MILASSIPSLLDLCEEVVLRNHHLICSQKQLPPDSKTYHFAEENKLLLLSTTHLIKPDEVPVLRLQPHSESCSLKYRVHEHVELPSSVYADIWRLHRTLYRPLARPFVEILQDSELVKLKSLDFRNLPEHYYKESLRSECLQLLSHYPQVVHFGQLWRPDHVTLAYLSNYGHKLKALTLGSLHSSALYPYFQILNKDLAATTSGVNVFERCWQRLGFTNLSKGGVFGRDFIVLCPKLESLKLDFDVGDPVIVETNEESMTIFIQALLKPCMDIIKHLQLGEGRLSWYNGLTGLGTLNLESLGLPFSVIDLPTQSAFNMFSSLGKSLRCLDLSGCGTFRYVSADDMIQKVQGLLLSLPHLVSLDASFTNFLYHHNESGELSSVMFALADRAWDFLGLVAVDYDVIHQQLSNITVHKVSGHKTLQQISVGLAMYSDPRIVKKLVTSLHVLCTDLTEAQKPQLLPVIQVILHPLSVDNSSSIKNMTHLKLIMPLLEMLLKKYSSLFTLNDLRDIVRCCALHLDLVMHCEGTMMYPEDIPLMAARVLQTFTTTRLVTSTVISRFWLPEIDRLLPCLLRVLQYTEDWFQTRALYIMKLLASNADHAQKKCIGKMVVEAVLNYYCRAFISNEHTKQAWSILWSLTDITEENCKLVVHHDFKSRTRHQTGLTLILDTLEHTGLEESLIHRLLGVLSNITEWESLKPLLFKERFFKRLMKLCTEGQTNEDIEISYHCCSIMVNLLMAKELSSWESSYPRRAQRVIIDCLSSWQVWAKRKVRYRTFAPMYDMIQRYDLLVVQCFGVWAIANFTFSKERYVRMLMDEAGLPLLEALLHNPSTASTLTAWLAKDILDRVTQYKCNPDSYDPVQRTLPEISEAEKRAYCGGGGEDWKMGRDEGDCEMMEEEEEVPETDVDWEVEMLGS